MKSFIRSLATAGLISATVFSSWIFQGTKVLALPTNEVVQKLQPVPVFTVADAQGAPLVAAGENNMKVAGVFISKKDANVFINKLKKENPELGKQVQVVPISLGQVYQLNQENKDKADGINFAYVPMSSEVEEAKKILQQTNEEYSGGVPLFVARAGEEQGYLTIKQNDKEVIPFFFEEDQVQNLIERFKKEQPDIASSIQIEVVPLEGVLAALETGDDEMLKKIMIWPSQESLDLIREASKNQPNPQK
jgi:hypothetical protein